MNKTNESSRLILFNLSILTIIAVAYLMYIWSSLILPFVIALLVSFWIISVSGFFSNMGMNKFFSYLFSAFCFFIFFFLLWWIINNNIEEITKPKNIEFYQNRFEEIFSPMLEYTTKLNINQEELRQKFLKSIDFSNVFSSVTLIITSILSSAWLIIIYILFILLEYRFFQEKISLISPDVTKRKKISSVIEKIKNDVKTYFLIKSLTSFFTWFLTYIVLSIFSVDFAMFWSFTIFILNFIPTIWSIIWVSIVSVFVVIQIWFTAILFLVILSLIWIQTLIWNIIEPKLMWNKLNLSPLVIILSLWLWWAIWWVVWMLLSVPIMVIINIILSNFESTKPISIMLSEKWVLGDEKEINIANTKKELYKLIKDNLKN